MADVDFVGMPQLLARLRELPDDVQIELRNNMVQTAERVVAMMKRLCPVRTGALRDSIGWTWGAPPRGAFSLGTVRGDQSALAISIFAGGTTATRRMQSRASGRRQSDQKRSGSFETDEARLIEFGTVHMAAQPFFYPAWRANRSRYKAGQVAALRRAVKKTFNQ